MKKPPTKHELRRMRTALTNATNKYSTGGRVRGQQKPRPITLARVSEKPVDEPGRH